MLYFIAFLMRMLLYGVMRSPYRRNCDTIRHNLVLYIKTSEAMSSKRINMVKKGWRVGIISNDTRPSMYTIKEKERAIMQCMEGPHDSKKTAIQMI